MEHQFELAFELLDIAAEQLVNDEYDRTELTKTTYYGLYTIINRHRYSRTGGHVLTVLAYEDDELQAAVEATTDHDQDEPHTRIVKSGQVTRCFTPPRSGPSGPTPTTPSPPRWAANSSGPSRPETSPPHTTTSTRRSASSWPPPNSHRGAGLTPGAGPTPKPDTPQSEASL